jgi:ATP-dependent DNA helicase RecG
MSQEDHFTDRKSLRLVRGKSADWDALARDSVCFANGQGGRLLIGIEDDQVEPPADQLISHEIINSLRKRIGELTVNVQAVPALKTSKNGGEFIELTIGKATGVASTCDGRYFLRVGDSCHPISGDDVLRLANERPGFPWETMDSLRIPRSSADSVKVANFVSGIRASARVKASVKEKTPTELLAHYSLSVGDYLTNLGVLLIGTRFDRSRLGTAPVVQFIKYDDSLQKVQKIAWDDYSLSPLELIGSIWNEVPDFKESYEFPEGLFRRTVPAFEEEVVRELLVNALVHRPYTQRGDIFLNLHPDQLQIVNPGRLPIGVTPQNILHESRRRNDGLARVFHDLGFMEREGSGFDLIYDRLLSSGRPAPTTVEGVDSVTVAITRRILKPEVMKLIRDLDLRTPLTQRERITLGVLAQTEGSTAAELSSHLELKNAGELKNWIGRLVSLEIVKTSGRTRGQRYFVDPQRLREARLDTRTTLSRIQPHRLQALILEDLHRYPDSSSTDINRRIGSEINGRTLKRALDQLLAVGLVRYNGEVRWRKYRLAEI